MPIHNRDFLKLYGCVVSVFLLVGSAAVPAQTTQQAIEARLKGQPLYLRGQWAPNDLQFDLAGTTSSPAISAPFTLSGIDVRQVKLAKDHLEIDADRVGLEFDQYTPKRVSLNTPVEIKIAGSRGTDYGPALDKIFADDLSALVPAMPFYWQHYAQSHLRADPVALNVTTAPAAQTLTVVDGATHAIPMATVPVVDRAGDPIRKVGGGVTMPVVIRQVSPEFSDEARAAKFNGSVLVGMIVNSQGVPENVHVIRGVGMGLDENAVLAVRQYRFRPAIEDGKPVPVLVNVEVNFQTFQPPKSAASAQIQPPQLTEKQDPVFTSAAKQLRYTATSLVHITVKEDGTVVDPYVIRPADLGLDEEALRAVGHYRFKPAIRDGAPIRSEIQIEVHFQVVQ